MALEDLKLEDGPDFTYHQGFMMVKEVVCAGLMNEGKRYEGQVLTEKEVSVVVGFFDSTCFPMAATLSYCPGDGLSGSGSTPRLERGMPLPPKVMPNVVELVMDPTVAKLDTLAPLETCLLAPPIL